jgi:uncharacterized membrane protein YbhN (UPF0104 family)
MKVSLPRSAWPKLLLRVGVAVALLTVVFHIALPAEGQGVFAALLSAWEGGLGFALLCLALAFAILGASFAIGALRFLVLLRGADLIVEWGALFRAYLVAGFFNLVLPGAILGDIYRLWDARREAGSGSRVAGVVVVERLLSLAALGSLGLVAAPFIPLAEGDRYLAWVLMAVCAAVAIATVAALHPGANRLMRRMLGPLEALSPRVAGWGDVALDSVAQLAESPSVLLRAYGMSLLNQGFPVAAVYVLALPLSGNVEWYWFAIIVPFVTLMSMVPISIGGTGVREYLYVTLFGAVGMPAEAALALSLSILAAAILWAIVGFAIFSLQHPEESAAG